MTTSQYRHRNSQLPPSQLPKAFLISSVIYLAIFASFLAKDLFLFTLKSEARVAASFRELDLQIHHFEPIKKEPVVPEVETKRLLNDMSQKEIEVPEEKKVEEKKPEEKKPEEKPLIKEEKPKPVEKKKEVKKEVKKVEPKKEKVQKPNNVKADPNNNVTTSKEGVATASQSNSQSGGDVSLSYGVDSNAMLSQIKRAIDTNLVYSRKARMMKLTGVVLVQFKITTKGELAFVKVLKSSGHEVLDNNAIETIRRAKRDFPKVSNNFIIKIPIKFILL